MKTQLLHTPEGVRDIYNEECEKKLLLQDDLFRLLRRYGYRPIQTPTFEFFDVFGRETGTTPSKDLYKFFDREGNTLVLRPDITPSIARCGAKYFGEEDMPIRLSYMGNTFINNSSYQGRLKESTQLGAELLGDPSVDADAEMIALAVECLGAAGLKEFQLGIGHADFFGGLMEAAGLEDEQREELRGLISNKNFFGVEEFIEPLQLPISLRSLFGMLGRLYNEPGELSEVRECAREYPRILGAILRLEELYELLGAYGVSQYVSIDLGTISEHQYYTGILFAGYTYGTGEAIVKGGRYDRLMAYFGKESESIGFAIVVDQLMAALTRQGIEPAPTRDTLLIVYGQTMEQRLEAIRHAKEQRATGRTVEVLARDTLRSDKDYEAYARRKHVAELRFV